MMDVSPLGAEARSAPSTAKAQDAPPFQGTSAAGSSSPASLESCLRQIRRRFTRMTDTDGLLPASAVLHPLYQIQDEDEEEGMTVSSSSSKEAIQTSTRQMQQALRSILAEASKQASKETEVNGEDMIMNTEGPSSSSSSTEELQAQRARFVSLLREQSLHSRSISEVTDSIMTGRKGQTPNMPFDGSGSATYPSLPVSMSVCALASGPSKMDWPTREHAVASASLRSLVEAFEAAAKEMKLEVFAEHHSQELTESSSSTNRDHPAHTLTLAAQIFVIDLDLTLKIEKDEYAPLVGLRLSYATDGAGGSVSTASRKAREALADVLRRDAQALADCIFGLSGGNRRSEEEANQHLQRLQAAVSTLQRLDRLSSKFEVDGSSDLFALMDKVCIAARGKATDLDQMQQDVSSALQSGLGVVLVHRLEPYVNLIYHTSDGDGTAVTMAQLLDLVDRRTLDGSRNKASIYSTKIDVGHSGLSLIEEHSNLADDALPSLSTTSTTRLQYIARLNPPVAMNRRFVDRLLGAAGVAQSIADEEASVAEANIDGQEAAKSDIAGLESILMAVHRTERRAHLEDKPSITPRQITKREDQGMMVRHFPFASLEHLKDALEVLREQIRTNDAVYAGLRPH